MRKFLMTGAALVFTSALGLTSDPAGATGERGEASERQLNEVIDRAIHAEGPFFTPEEQALIERKCGYAPGSWNGKNISINNGVLHCENGRRVSDPEVRAMMRVVEPRIERRVEAAMSSPEVRRAIDAVVREAEAEALSELAARHPRRERD